MRRAAIVLAAALALAGCGKRDSLRPVAGAALPPRPARAATQPTPEALLMAPTTTRPTREDEVLRKSEVRQDDRFDLPPPG